MNELINKSKLIMNLADWALSEAPDERHEGTAFLVKRAVYDTIQECIKAVERQPSAQQPYFIQLKNIVSNDDFRRILEDLKHQCENIVLLHEYEQLVYPAQRWIPCSERLPETNSRVLITIWGRSCEAVFDKDGAWIMAVPFIESTIYKNQFRPEFITAWMPLPEPYKEENK